MACVEPAVLACVEPIVFACVEAAALVWVEAIVLVRVVELVVRVVCDVRVVSAVCEEPSGRDTAAFAGWPPLFFT